MPRAANSTTSARTKRIRFTKNELDLIINMACIAEAFGISEWTEADWKSIGSIMRKANELLRRKK